MWTKAISQKETIDNQCFYCYEGSSLGKDQSTHIPNQTTHNNEDASIDS